MQSLFNFDNEASTYDEYYDSDLGRQIDALEKECVKHFLSKVTKGKILELGSGTGHWSEWISQQGFHVHGIDISEKMLEKANSKNIENCKFEFMSMTDLQFGNNSVENIIAVTSLEFSVDLDKTFSEIKRVLKPNGTFIAAVLNSESVIGKYKNDNPTFADANFFTTEELRSRLSVFGTPQFCESAFLNNKFEIVSTGEPAMIVGYVKNTQTD